MIISHKYKLVILLPWKTASQTLRLRLRHIDESPYPQLQYFNLHLNRVIHQHITLLDFMALPEASMGYKLAVFIRNPYDRVFSGFQQIIRDFTNQPRMNIAHPWVQELINQQLSDNFQEVCKSGYNINYWFLRLPLYKIFEAGRDTSLYLHPNYYWTHKQGKIIVDFVGRVENFEEDFKAFCNKYGFNSSSDKSANQSNECTPEKNEYGYRYINKYDPETILRINEIFKADFDFFNYKVINPQLP